MVPTFSVISFLASDLIVLASDLIVLASGLETMFKWFLCFSRPQLEKFESLKIPHFLWIASAIHI